MALVHEIHIHTRILQKKAKATENMHVVTANLSLKTGGY